MSSLQVEGEGVVEVPSEDVWPGGLPEEAGAGRRPDHVPERGQVQAGPLGCNHSHEKELWYIVTRQLEALWV